MKLLVIAAVMLLAVVQEPVYEAGPGITLPTVVREVKPDYTPQAMSERVQGSVHLTVVVGTSGEPREIRVTKPLHADLDQAAIDALQQWQFRAGSREGKAVSVRVQIEMTFTLK